VVGMATIVAAVQAAPVFLDREATIDKAGELVKQAAAAGAQLVAFSETFVPTYPDWVWRAPAWSDGEFVRRLYAQSVTVPSPATERLGAIARDCGVYLAMGVSELAGGTMYNSLVYFAPDGSLAGRHRKLMPTGGERTVWGTGDGSTLDVVRTPFGVVGGLICWENYMPLARAAMYARGVDVYLAPTWDNSDTWVATLRHIAKEGRVYVLGIAPLPVRRGRPGRRAGVTPAVRPRGPLRTSGCVPPVGEHHCAVPGDLRGKRLTSPESRDDLAHAFHGSGVGQVRQPDHHLVGPGLGQFPEPPHVVVDRSGVDGGGVPGGVAPARPQPRHQVGQVLVVGADERGGTGGSAGPAPGPVRRPRSGRAGRRPCAGWRPRRRRRSRHRRTGRPAAGCAVRRHRRR